MDRKRSRATKSRCSSGKNICSSSCSRTGREVVLHTTQDDFLIDSVRGESVLAAVGVLIGDYP